MSFPHFLQQKLQERKQNNAFRQLSLPNNLIDFCSNDYLGIVKNNILHNTSYTLQHGSTGSRLITGNYELIENVEQQIAQFHDAEAALIFNSGYDANIGLLSCIAQRGDTIIYDSLCHASIRDGIRLSFANSYNFLHNNIADLEEKLQQAKGNIFIVTETVFSMDGDEAPLQEIVQLAEKYKAQIVVDEAHAIGVYGNSGEGLSQQQYLHNNILARVYTYGKALGCHGAAVVGSSVLRQYLINFARSFIYTTALPPVAVNAINNAYKAIETMTNERQYLQQLITTFKQHATLFTTTQSNSSIQAIIVNGNEQVKAMATMAVNAGFNVKPILYPTVPKGSERLRIVLHSFNTQQQITSLLQSLHNGK